MEVEEKASLMNEKDKATFGIQKSRIKFEVVELFLIEIKFSIIIMFRISEFIKF